MWRIGRRSLFSEPFFLQWHITNLCGLSCRHCYRQKGNAGDLSLEHLLQILDKFEVFLKNINRCGRIQITGGEPFLSPHLPQILHVANKKNIPCRILSSGVNIPNSVVGEIVSLGCRLVQISIEGERDVNDSIRGEGSFEKAVETMKFLRANDVEVTVNMTVSKVNAGEVEKVMRTASIYADRFNIARFVPINDEKTISAADILNPLETRNCFETVYRYKIANRGIDIPLRDPLWHGYFYKPFFGKKQGIHGCSAGYNGITVDYDGTIYPCRRLPLGLGNILNTDFFTVWTKSRILGGLRDRDLLKGKCGKCKIRWECGGCRAAAYAAKKDYLGEDTQCFSG